MKWKKWSRSCPIFSSFFLTFVSKIKQNVLSIKKQLTNERRFKKNAYFCIVADNPPRHDIGSILLFPAGKLRQLTRERLERQERASLCIDSNGSCHIHHTRV